VSGYCFYFVVGIGIAAAAVPLGIHVTDDSAPQYEIERTGDVRSPDMHIEADTLGENEIEILTDVGEGPAVDFTQADVETSRFYTGVSIENRVIAIHEGSATQYYKIGYTDRLGHSVQFTVVSSLLVFVGTTLTLLLVGSKIHKRIE